MAQPAPPQEVGCAAGSPSRQHPPTPVERRQALSGATGLAQSRSSRHLWHEPGEQSEEGGKWKHGVKVPGHRPDPGLVKGMACSRP